MIQLSGNKRSMKIILVEDQRMFLDSLKETLSQVEGFEVVAAISNADEVDELCRQHSPDIVLMDVCTEKGASGIEAAKRIHKKFPGIHTIIMTGMQDIDYVDAARKAGVSSFIYKNIPLRDLVSVIQQTRDNYSVFPDTPKMPVMGSNTLTERETEILRSYCEGKSRLAIAEEMGLSESTVKADIRNMLQKTDFPNLSRLAIYAVSNHYIVPGVSSEGYDEM